MSEPEYNRQVFFNLVQLIRLTLTGLGKLSDAPDWSTIFSMARGHMVCALVAQSATSCGCDQETAGRFQEEQLKCLRKTLCYAEERKQLFSDFDRAGIYYIPLKGIVIGPFYPVPNAREFADNDILVSGEPDEVDEIFRSRGFDKTSSGPVHDVYQKEPFYNFEIHHTLFDKGVHDLPIFEKIWDRALPDGEGTCAYHFSEADFYVYQLAHFQKHYFGGGAGLRSFVDFYLIDRRISDESRPEIDQAVREAGLEDFQAFCCHTTYALFEGDPCEIGKDDLDYIASSCSYGSLEHMVRNQVGRVGKRSYLFHRIFPPYRTMKTIFPFVRVVPIFLPLGWLVRWIRAVFSPSRRRRTRQEIRVLKKSGERG